MRTVFIPIFQGAEAKNILRTGIYKKLISNSYLRLVFFVGSPERADYYKNEFNHERVIYEIAPAYRPSLFDRLFESLQFKLIKTKSLDLRRKMALQDSGNYPVYILSYLFNRIFACRWIRKLTRFLDWILIRQPIFSPYFDKYKPAAVFLAHLFDNREISMLREARQRRISTIGFVNSWDKLTTRGMIRFLPDKLLVFNETVKQEALELTDMKFEDIIIVGIPQYDVYINPSLTPREEFYKKVGIKPTKRIIVYAPMGRYFSDSDWDIIDLFRSALEKKLFFPDVDLLVRFQPNDFIDEEELKKRPGLKYDRPGIRFSRKRGVDWDMSFVDLQHLTDTLYYSAVFICYATSLSIDAAVFDKPVININFEVKEKQRLSQTPTHFYKTTHYSKAAMTGGIRFPNSREELIEWINKYLKDPTWDRKGRQRLREQQCGELDGRASERIANIIIDTIFKS